MKQIIKIRREPELFEILLKLREIAIELRKNI